MAKFRTRARAVDMLGRQQIAGIPTAISELFKNAHDAYAGNVQVDYFRSDGLFVLRDNGVGMTKEDFENRWLTIGTESKLEGQTNLKRNYVPPDKPERPVMGEKGIGRLAIAIIGRQVLVLSRAVREDGLKDLVAAFIHWNIFALPGIDIEEIEIPVRVFNGGTLPSVDDVLSMTDVVRQNVLALSDKISENERNIILSDLESFKVNPSSFESFAEGPSLSGEGTGTHFYIYPSDETISMDIDKDKQAKDDLVFTKFLVGFTNTMITDPSKLPMTVAFKDWRTDRKGDFQELIGPEAFITPEEFANTDHHFTGVFDEYGQFSGSVRIYGKDPVAHVIPWPNKGGRKTLCGSFKIYLACIQGILKESHLSPELYAEIDSKFFRLGGVYIYRDGIRVLPYGNYDHDFLEVEKRRSKGAGYYYFSYRKMAGVIEITKQANSDLIEKAGREGFQSNKAYRQFVDILKNFLLQLAADFFRDEGAKSSDFIEKREDLKRLSAAKEKQTKLATAKKTKLSTEFNLFFEKIESGTPNKTVETIFEEL